MLTLFLRKEADRRHSGITLRRLLVGPGSVSYRAPVSSLQTITDKKAKA
jgi:hypothetical protein